jgi:NAD(P)-dependent dehydrogenase (short-subunit alcohol dehydrogenase family)
MHKKTQDQKTVLITGASSGLGAYLASSFSKSSMNVVINFHKGKKNADLLAKKLSLNNNVISVKGDVSKFKDAKYVVNQTIKQFGRIDVLVNNAGIHLDNTVQNMTPKTWSKVMETNLNGVFNFNKAVLPQMKKQKFGRIINISSFTAFRGVVGASNYAASKAGIVGFTKSFAKEVAKYNVTVNAIAPGYFDIGMFYDISLEVQKIIQKQIPAERLGQPEEISQLIRLLIEMDYLTGQIFTLDGGFSI